MSWKSKRERSQYYSMLLRGQIIHLNSSFKTLYEQVEYAQITTSELHTFKPPKTPTFNQMQNIETYENYFVQNLINLFKTLEKTEVLHKYDVIFRVRPKNDKRKMSKEKLKMLKK